MWRQGFLSGSGGAERVTESVVFSGLFVFFVCVCSGRSQGDRKSRSLCVHSSRVGDTSPHPPTQMNSPPFWATEKQKQTQQEKGGKGRKAERSGRPQLSSFSGRLPTREPGRGGWTALVHRAPHTRPAAKALIPHTAHPASSPGGQGGAVGVQTQQCQSSKKPTTKK